MDKRSGLFCFFREGASTRIPIYVLLLYTNGNSIIILYGVQISGGAEEKNKNALGIINTRVVQGIPACRVGIFSYEKLETYSVYAGEKKIVIDINAV